MKKLTNNEINEAFLQEELSLEENNVTTEDYGSYLYNEQTAHERRVPDVIDKLPIQDEEIIELTEPKFVSGIEGNVEQEDKERGVVVTTIYNAKEGYSFNRLYDVSGERPVLLASGRNLEYKDGYFIVHYPNKQLYDDRGDYLNNMQSALYKLDENNSPKFVANNVLNIVKSGWFEKPTGNSYEVYLCRDNGDNSYQRIMKFGADMSGHREVTDDGIIIDELDRTDWYHKDFYMYNSNTNQVLFLKGEGYERFDGDYEYEHENDEREPDLVIGDAKIYCGCKESRFRDRISGKYNYYSYVQIKDDKTGGDVLKLENNLSSGLRIKKKDDRLEIFDKESSSVKVFDFVRDTKEGLQARKIDERPMSLVEKYADRRAYPCKYGTFYVSDDCYSAGTFVSNEGEENTKFAFGRRGETHSCSIPLYNGLSNFEITHIGFDSWSKKGVYDFKQGCVRDDLAAVVDLGDNFYAVKKNGEEKFGIYEVADEEMKNPLIMVDNCKLVGNNVIYSIGDTKYRSEITSEGKLKPIAMQKGENSLSLALGEQWVEIPIENMTKVAIDSEYGITLEKYEKIPGEEYKEFIGTQRISNEQALKYARSVVKKSKTEKIEKVKEGYHNARERILKARENIKISGDSTSKIEATPENRGKDAKLPTGIKPSKKMKMASRS